MGRDPEGKEDVFGGLGRKIEEALEGYKCRVNCGGGTSRRAGETQRVSMLICWAYSRQCFICPLIQQVSAESLLNTRHCSRHYTCVEQNRHSCPQGTYISSDINRQ